LINLIFCIQACLKKENKDIVKVLIQNKADVNAKDIDGKSPLLIGKI
jgi:ankyrin repeat protein